MESLPATVVDGNIVKTKTYPTNAEIAEWLDIPVNYLGEEADKSNSTTGTDSSGCNCKGGCC